MIMNFKSSSEIKAYYLGRIDSVLLFARWKENQLCVGIDCIPLNDVIADIVHREKETMQAFSEKKQIQIEP